LDQIPLIVLGAIVGSLATYVLTEPRRRAERRDDQLRHEQELAEARAESVANAERERQLTALLQTRQMLGAMLADAGAILAGPGATKPGRYGPDVFPRADPALVGYSTALSRYFEVIRQLSERPPGSGFRQSDGVASSEAQLGITDALDAQEARILRGEPLRTLSASELGPTHAAILAAIEMVGRGRNPNA
jgi:hypothetical protein